MPIITPPTPTPFGEVPLGKLIAQYEQFYAACESAKRPDPLSRNILRDTIIELRDRLEYLYLYADKFDQYERQVRWHMLSSEEREEFVHAWTILAMNCEVQVNRKSIVIDEDQLFKMPTGKILGSFQPGDRVHVYVNELMDSFPFYPDELIIKVGSNLDIRKKSNNEYENGLS